MNSSVYEKMLEERFNMFIRAEYIKRNFEYTSKEAVWVKENWDIHMNEMSNIHHDKVLIMNDFINFYHAIKNQRGYDSIITKKMINFFRKLCTNDLEWVERVYKISLNYGLSFAELITPYRMDSVINMKNKIFILPIPNFIDQYMNNITVECSDMAFVFGVDFTDEDFDFKKTIDLFSQQFAISLAKMDIKSHEIERCVSDIVDEDNKVTTYDNSRMSRLYGLFQWDFRLEYGRTRNVLNLFREKIRELGWPYCLPEEKCEGLCLACKKRLNDQFRGTKRSIEAMSLQPISAEGQIKMPENARLLLSRYELPAEDAKFKMDF